MQDPNIDDLKSDGWGDVLNIGLPLDMTLKNVLAYREYNGVFGSARLRCHFRYRRPTRESSIGNTAMSCR